MLPHARGEKREAVGGALGDALAEADKGVLFPDGFCGDAGVGDVVQVGVGGGGVAEVKGAD